MAPVGLGLPRPSPAPTRTRLDPDGRNCPGAEGRAGPRGIEGLCWPDPGPVRMCQVGESGSGVGIATGGLHLCPPAGETEAGREGEELRGSDGVREGAGLSTGGGGCVRVGSRGGTAPRSLLEVLGARTQPWSCHLGTAALPQLPHHSEEPQLFPAPRGPCPHGHWPHTFAPVPGEPAGAVVCIPGLPVASTSPPASSPASTGHVLWGRPQMPHPRAKKGQLSATPHPPLPWSQATSIVAATKRR